jgi:hypothetical protein
MTKVQLSLPDELAKAAGEAGLLAPDAMQAMLRDRLRTAGLASLEKAWAKAGDKAPSEADERLITEAVGAVRKAA